MGRKKKISEVSNTKLTDCSIVIEVLGDVFIPRYEPGFDSNWGDRSWHVATIKKADQPPTEDLPDTTVAEDTNLQTENLKNGKSCDRCSFKTSKTKSLKNHMLTAHNGSNESKTDSINRNKKKNSSPKKIKDSNTEEKNHNKKSPGSRPSKVNRGLNDSNDFNEGINNSLNEGKSINSLSEKKKNQIKETKNKGQSPGTKKHKLDNAKIETEKSNINVIKDLNESQTNAVNENKSKSPKASSTKKTQLKSPVIKTKKQVLNISNGENKSFNKIKKNVSFNIDDEIIDSPMKSKPGTIRYSFNAEYNGSGNENNSLNDSKIQSAKENKNKSPVASPKKKKLDSDVIEKEKRSVNVNGSFDDDIDKNRYKLATHTTKSKPGTIRYSFNVEHDASANELKKSKNKSPKASPKKKASVDVKMDKHTVNVNHDIVENSYKSCDIPAKSKLACAIIKLERHPLINVKGGLNESEDSNLNKKIESDKKSEPLVASPLKRKLDTSFIKIERHGTVHSESKTNFHGERKRRASIESNSRSQVSPSPTKKKKFDSQLEKNSSHERGSDRSNEVTHSFSENENNVPVSAGMEDNSDYSLPLKTVRVNVARVSDENRKSRTSSYPLSCKYCNFKCRNNFVMKKHVILIHNNGKYFKCKLCDFKTAILSHFQVHHVVHRTVRRYHCEQCDYKGKSKNALVTHKKSHNTLRPFKCDQCPYTCKSKQHLKMHSYVHSDVRPVACKLCSFTCKIESQLKVHSIVHEEDKPFLCELCDFSCKYPTNLKRHMVTHSNARPFKCSSCSRCFKTKSLLKNHTLVHIFLKPYYCNKCKWESRTLQGLKKHFKVVHGGFKLIINVD